MNADTTEIRAILAPITGGQFLLPGSVLAEVIDLEAVRAYEDKPAWLIGGVSWQDWNVPVVSMAVLGGTAEAEDPGPRSRVLVIKSLAPESAVPYIGILISGVPRLTRVNESSLTQPKRLKEHPCVFRAITVDEQTALVPDLDKLVETLEPAVAED